MFDLVSYVNNVRSTFIYKQGFGLVSYINMGLGLVSYINRGFGLVSYRNRVSV